MHYDVIVIGGGLSGLTAGSLLAKRGLKVAVVEKSYNPGGSCGVFKRDDILYDQGAAMLYGFGEKGFNAHRFVFNCLQEPIEVIRHDLLYCVNFKGNRIKFWPDLELFTEELAQIFPSERMNIKRFYRDMEKMYHHVMVENPNYTTPDETDPKSSLRAVLRHPVSHMRFWRFLNQSVKSLLEKYFQDPEIFKFFDKLTSTYCYTTVEESPAILAAVMFVDNHVGGSYYPAGSTLFLPGKLEKVIEENGGEMWLENEVIQIMFQDGKPSGVALASGQELSADNLIYSGTVWNLYGKLIGQEHTTNERMTWAQKQVPTYPSMVLYALVDRQIIPEDTLPVEMLVGNPDQLDESEVTAYISSIDDHTLCPTDCHVVVAIGPSFQDWNMTDPSEYLEKKEQEKERLLEVLEKKFPGFNQDLRYAEVATPRTIERYTNKNGGAVAGPKQMLGQHLFNRLHIRSEWDNLFCCGESTIMGTGTPTVTTSGLSAANAILKKLGKATYTYQSVSKNYVQVVAKPFTVQQQYRDYPVEVQQVMRRASACQYCEWPRCSMHLAFDIRGLMRRVTVGNFIGAKKIVHQFMTDHGLTESLVASCQEACIKNKLSGKPVEIMNVVEYIKNYEEVR